METDTFEEQVTSLKRRIAQAEFERDGCRAAGRQEKYLEAYCMVEALELQLETRLQRHGAGGAAA
jgi:hypothetical protein